MKGVGDGLGEVTEGAGVGRRVDEGAAVADATGDAVGDGGVLVGAPVHAARTTAKSNVKYLVFTRRIIHQCLSNYLGNVIMDY